jgi:hypothetical protein
MALLVVGTQMSKDRYQEIQSHLVIKYPSEEWRHDRVLEPREVYEITRLLKSKVSVAMLSDMFGISRDGIRIVGESL